MNSKLYKKADEINSKEVLKADSYQELKEKMNQRIKKKYKPSKVKWIWKLQYIFTNWNLSRDEVYTDICKQLVFTIEAKANWLEYRYKSVRLSYHDFEAELWKATWDAIIYYEESGDIETEFTLLETLELFWKTRIKNYIISCLFTKKNSPWYTASSISEDDNRLISKSTEELVLISETVKEMFNDSELTEIERMLLFEIYDNPNGSLRSWGKDIGLSHPEEVRRLYKSIRKKLDKYK